MKQKQQFFSMDEWRKGKREDARLKLQDKRDGWDEGRAIHDTLNAWLDTADKNGHCLVNDIGGYIEQAVWELKMWVRHSTRYAVIVFENGIALTAFAMTYGMPLVVELGVLFDLLIAVVVAWVYARRMLDVFGSTSTDKLRSLRG